MSDFFKFASENDDTAAIMIMFGCGMVVLLAIIIADVIRKTAERREFEMSRREIAAYIAESSITPEQGERLLQVGGKPGKDMKKG